MPYNSPGSITARAEARAATLCAASTELIRMARELQAESHRMIVAQKRLSADPQLPA